MVKSRRRCTGTVACGGKRTECRDLLGKPEEKKPIGRHMYK
jgi:hypothetical protein